MYVSGTVSINKMQQKRSLTFMKLKKTTQILFYNLPMITKRTIYILKVILIT